MPDRWSAEMILLRSEDAMAGNTADIDAGAARAAPVEPHDAVIFIPGINLKSGQTLTDVARRFTAALDQRAATAAASFRPDDQGTFVTGVPNVSVCSILRKDQPGATERPIIDLFFLDYRAQINQQYGDLSDVQRIFFLFLAIVGSLKRFLVRPLNLYPDCRDWRLLGLRLVAIAGLVVYLGLWHVAPVYRAWHAGQVVAWGWWGWAAALAFAIGAAAALAALVFASPRPLSWNAWFRFVGAVAGVAAVGSYLGWCYGANLKDFVIGTHDARSAFRAVDLVRVALLLSAALALVVAASLEFGAANQPVTDRQHFQVLLCTLALSNLVVYLAILVLAFFHTAKQQVQYWSSGTPAQAQETSDAGGTKAKVPPQPTKPDATEPPISETEVPDLPVGKPSPADTAKAAPSGGSTTKKAAAGGPLAPPPAPAPAPSIPPPTPPTGAAKPAPTPAAPPAVGGASAPAPTLAPSVAPPPTGAATSPPAPTAPTAGGGAAPATSLPTVPQQIVIVVTGILFLLRPSWKAGVTAMGNTYLYFYYYLGYGRVRPEVVGQFRTLVEKVAELTTVVKVQRADGTEVDQAAPLYERIHVVGYSFGSVVALDSLYPFNQEPPGRFSVVDAFVTIACPFDVIRTYFTEYPDPPAVADPASAARPDPPYSYFEKRDALPDAPKRWLNIYSLSDVMSSNFRDDERVDVASRGIGLRPEGTARRQGAPQPGPLAPQQNVHFVGPYNAATTTFWDLFTLYGIRSHAGYWGQGNEIEVNCFDVIIPWLYQGHHYLS
jgi:hypothetical protein